MKLLINLIILKALLLTSLKGFAFSPIINICTYSDSPLDQSLLIEIEKSTRETLRIPKEFIKKSTGKCICNTETTLCVELKKGKKIEIISKKGNLNDKFKIFAE